MLIIIQALSKYLPKGEKEVITIVVSLQITVMLRVVAEVAEIPPIHREPVPEEAVHFLIAAAVMAAAEVPDALQDWLVANRGVRPVHTVPVEVAAVLPVVAAVVGNPMRLRAVGDVMAF